MGYDDIQHEYTMKPVIGTTYIDRVDSRLFLQSSDLGHPTPSPAGDCPPFGSGWGYTLACGRVGGGPNSDEGTDTVVL
jgi:hypothetical protein